MKTEKRLQQYLRRLCAMNSISFDKVESRSRRGFPDCFLVYKSVVVLVELKTPAGTGRLSEHQKLVIGGLIDHGLWVEVIDSKEGVDQLIEILLKEGEL